MLVAAHALHVHVASARTMRGMSSAHSSRSPGHCMIISRIPDQFKFVPLRTHCDKFRSKPIHFFYALHVLTFAETCATIDSEVPSAPHRLSRQRQLVRYRPSAQNKLMRCSLKTQRGSEDSALGSLLVTPPTPPDASAKIECGL